VTEVRTVVAMEMRVGEMRELSGNGNDLCLVWGHGYTAVCIYSNTSDYTFICLQSFTSKKKKLKNDH
jgi:hypothetical protein